MVPRRPAARAGVMHPLARRPLPPLAAISPVAPQLPLLVELTAHPSFRRAETTSANQRSWVSEARPLRPGPRPKERRLGQSRDATFVTIRRQSLLGSPSENPTLPQARRIHHPSPGAGARNKSESDAPLNRSCRPVFCPLPEHRGSVPAHAWPVPSRESHARPFKCIPHAPTRPDRNWEPSGSGEGDTGIHFNRP